MTKVYVLSREDVAMLLHLCETADANGQEVRVAWHDLRGLIVKRGGGMWTHPMGEPESGD